MLTLIFSDLPALAWKHVVKKRGEILQTLKESDVFKFRTKILWKNVALFTYFHVMASIGLYLMFFVGTWKTFFWTCLLVQVGNWGMTLGVHRLWSHRSYKAKLPLRIILMLWQTLAFQKPIFDWVRDHRAHHKYTHTDADPQNPERGHFYAHLGCLLMRKHEDVLKKGVGIDVSDVMEDPVVRFQSKYFWHLGFLTGFFFPGIIPWYFWGEDLLVCAITPSFFRFVYTLHMTLFVNSVAHAWGTKPYDKNIGPVDNALLSFLSGGEGWHNYHHIFPWDYKAGELGSYELNTSTMLIDFFSKIGWAYDMRTVSEEMIRKRIARTGDTSGAYHYSLGNDYSHQQRLPWGWGDTDMKEDEKEMVNVYYEVPEEENGEVGDKAKED